MVSFIHGLLAAALVLCPMLAQAGHGGGYCRAPYCAPKQPIVNNVVPVAYPNNTVQYIYTINYSQPPAAQGTTAFSYNAVAATYQNTDLAAQALIALGSRLADNAVQAASLGTTAVQVTAANNAQINANNAQALRIAETQTNAAAAERYLQSIRPAPQASVFVQPGVTVQSSVVANGVAQAPAPQAVANVGLAAIHANRCAGCHGDQATAATKGGNAVLPQFEQLTPEQKVVVRGRVTSHSTEKRMPKNGALPDEELAALLDFLCK